MYVSLLLAHLGRDWECCAIKELVLKEDNWIGIADRGLEKSPGILRIVRGKHLRESNRAR
jgi:hypothetical protein